MPPWCTGNSPQIAGLGLWELNLDHRANTQGFKLLGMSLDHQFYDLDVKHGELLAEDSGNNVALRGKKLIGSTLWLQQGGSQFGLVIADVGVIQEVVSPGGALFTYKLQWSSASPRLGGYVYVGKDGRFRVRTDGDPLAVEPRLGPENLPVCPVWDGQTILPGWTTTGTKDDPGYWPWIDRQWDESTKIPAFNAIVFEGDRIDATNRTVDPKPDDRWFNIGCARHTLAKMRITRNTLHTTQPPNDWRDVQATLKMLSADYCGTGQAVTVAGTPLVWQQPPIPGFRTSTPRMTYHAIPTSLEARWDEHGAICLDRKFARLKVHPPTPTVDIDQAITQACIPSGPRVAVRRLRDCADQDVNDMTAGERITSANWTP